jgi:hypothetical protein
VDIRFAGTLFVDIRFAGTLFVDIRSAATLFADTLSEKAARIAPPSSLATTIRGCTAREELGKAVGCPRFSARSELAVISR